MKTENELLEKICILQDKVINLLNDKLDLLQQLKSHKKESNDLVRSFYSICERLGTETDWSSIKEKCDLFLLNNPYNQSPTK